MLENRCKRVLRRLLFSYHMHVDIWIWISGTTTGNQRPPRACQQENLSHSLYAWDNGRPQCWCLRRRLGPPSRRGRRSPFTYRDVSYRSHRLQFSWIVRSTRFIEFVFSRMCVPGDKGPRACSPKYVVRTLIPLLPPTVTKCEITCKRIARTLIIVNGKWFLDDTRPMKIKNNLHDFMGFHSFIIYTHGDFL